MPTKLTSQVLSGGRVNAGLKTAPCTSICAPATHTSCWKTMIIYEPRQPLEVDTPKGRGRVWLVTDYGGEIEKLFAVIINESGEIWEFTNKDIKATKNTTMGRGKW